MFVDIHTKEVNLRMLDSGAAKDDSNEIAMDEGSSAYFRVTTLWNIQFEYAASCGFD